MDDATSAGLTILRASRLEDLLPPLLDLLDATRPEAVLEPQTVIAAHPGMKQWLGGALARQRGAGRIVANLEVMLPSSWLDSLSTEVLGERAVALPKYRRGHLRWTIHGLLGDPARHGIGDPRVLGYLDGAVGADERALRRFQLADQLARVFSQYLVYRGEWLAAWEAGKRCFATANVEDAALRALEAQCLAPLWEAVAAALGEHRGRMVDALLVALKGAHAVHPPLHVVGLSHLPPAELSVLRAYTRHAPVFLYVPDPCREYWGGLQRSEAQGGWRIPDAAGWMAFRASEAKRLEDPDALDWREQGHPLLARWGRLGQHFFAALADGEVREDIRHWKDEQPTTPADRLARLQESIRRLEPGLMREDVAAPGADADASLRIHACHTRQRELEVLRDAMLDAIDRDGVRAGDIVVMAPDIQAYLPLIPAIFGEPGSTRERRLPYHLADVPVARSHPLFAAFATLLGMGASRITAPEVVDLLGVAEVRRALGLDAGDADTLVEWLRRSRVAWALDGAHRQAMSLPARTEHSFAWAMDRLIAGYLMADGAGEIDPQAFELPDGATLLPIAGVEGPAAAALGSLDRLLCELQAWRELAQRELPASAWSELLRARVDALLRIDATDADARAALSVVHRAIAQLASEPARNGEDPPLRLAVVRELLQDALAAAPERQRFLMGGITFCGMVPQRAIPFDMVCVLGLDEGAFPRRPSDGGIDLMARLRRLGDRDVPGDDRYLFLETVMAARKRLHLSYIGQGVRDGKHRNPASPLAELVAELETRCGIAPDDAHAPRPWLVRHPLQPFDGRYFDGTHPALFSFSPAFADMCGNGLARLPGLRNRGLPTPVPLPDPLPLASLEGFFKDPAKALLKEHLELSLDALDDDERLPQDEPMDAIPRIHTVARRVFLQHLLPRRCGDPDWTWDRQPPAWVRHGGLLPPGEAGAVAWANEAAAVEALWQQAEACGRFDARAMHGGQALQVDVPLGLAAEGTADARRAPRITGLLRNVFPLAGSQDGVHVVFVYPKASEKAALKESADLEFKERVPAFLHWALLRLHLNVQDVPVPVRLTMLADGECEVAIQANDWDAHYCAADAATREVLAADLRRRVRGLVTLMQKGREGQSWFYPGVGWKVVQSLSGNAPGQVGPATGADAQEHGVPETNRPATSAGAAARQTRLVGKLRGAWIKDFGDTAGERDYGPGYTRLLEGDLVFGDPETDPGGRALDALLQDAQAINTLILLGDAGDADPSSREAAA